MREGGGREEKEATESIRAALLVSVCRGRGTGLVSLAAGDRGRPLGLAELSGAREQGWEGRKALGREGRKRSGELAGEQKSKLN